MRWCWLVLLVACGEATPEPTHEASACPAGHARDPVHARALESALASVPQGSALVPLLGRTEGMCFAPDALNVVTTGGVLLVARDLPEREAAARLGHLLVHVRDGLPMGDAPPPGVDCETVVAQALDREAVAYVSEVRLQRALGVTPTVLAFEFADTVAALPERDAIAEVRRYLEAHPTGAPGIDGLAAGYRERCLRGR